MVEITKPLPEGTLNCETLYWTHKWTVEEITQLLVDCGMNEAEAEFYVNVSLGFLPGDVIED